MKTTQHYTTPEVEIVEMEVEQGFSATSSGSSGNIDGTENGGNLEDDNN